VSAAAPCGMHVLAFLPCLAWLQVLPADGLLVALDRDQKSMAMARQYWVEAGVGGLVSDGSPAPQP
jgi:hypothetical protein